MSRSVKILILIITILPLIVLFISVGSYEEYQVRGTGSYLMFAFFLSILAFLFYLIHVLRNKWLNTETKFLYILGFLFLSVIVETIYWYLHIWKNKGT
ncbi:MAG: hypothetical protein ACNS62_19760 [Candidatus Cyclobacteriaceae bacterium M3_2C_046]